MALKGEGERELGCDARLADSTFPRQHEHYMLDTLQRHDVKKMLVDRMVSLTAMMKK